MKHCILLSMALIVLGGCKQEGCTDPSAINYNSEANKDDGSCSYDYELAIQLGITYNNSAVEQYGVFENQGINYRLERCTYYLSHLSLDDVSMQEVHLYNLEDPSTHTISFTVQKDTYNTLTFGLGLDNSLNASDPSSFDIDHPLSIAQNTYWQMEPPSYIYVKLELKADTLGGDNFNYPLTYHLAHNELYRSVSINTTIDFNNENKQSLPLNLAIDQVFNNINIQEVLPHSSNNSALAQQLMNNIANAFIIQ